MENLSKLSFSFLVFFFCLHGHLYSAEVPTYHRNCPPFPCGKFGDIKFPFARAADPINCGLLFVHGCEEEIQKIQLEKGGRWYQIESISQADTIFIYDEVFQKHLSLQQCETFNNLTIPSFPFLHYQITRNLTLFKCNLTPGDGPRLGVSYLGCKNFSVNLGPASSPSLQSQCSIIQLPHSISPSYASIFTQLTARFSLKVHVSPACTRCHYRGGLCQTSTNGNFRCAKAGGANKLPLELGLGLGIGCLCMLIMLLYIFHRRYRRKHATSNLTSTNSSSEPFSKSDLQGGSFFFGVPVYSYKELEEATTNFDGDKELGDGGFGTVYYGKLRDGREVAVKRLYEHNYRRHEQFMNEIAILTRLRHKNLVSLYGCTSRQSRELLLVYEYIPNGTVADHLHGDRANFNLLTWPVRMRIAIETASALAYLHASDVVHRDVKTSNILLDDNFSVKVADFGLSRLFPADVSHVSTAPQGTPGYVDPEYHQCYQLTGKSDVYSFGVVMIELVSSKPAVDITRERSEINLANLAINKIKQCALDELIDAQLGYKTNGEVKRMTASVAELAFRCLQQDKEMRPSMEEVLEELNKIEMGEQERNQEEIRDVTMGSKAAKTPSSPLYCDEAALLKNIRPPPSPDSVTNKWMSSSSTTPSVSS